MSRKTVKRSVTLEDEVEDFLAVQRQTLLELHEAADSKLTRRRQARTLVHGTTSTSRPKRKPRQ